jgi:hypothetical protein
VRRLRSANPIPQELLRDGLSRERY